MTISSDPFMGPTRLQPPAGKLRGPADPDSFRVKVGRYSDRWYHDPMDGCRVALATAATWPSVSIVKGANGRDWTYTGLKRAAAAFDTDTYRKLAQWPYEDRYEALKAINKVGLNQASKRGQNVHLMAEARLYGHPLTVVEGDPGYEYLAAVDQFFDQYQPTLVAAEFVCIHRDLNGVGYGGTADAIIEIDRKRYIVDWKGLAVDTPIPTPDGWKSMGELAVGDVIFGSAGQPVVVTAKSDTHWTDCYRIYLDDGSDIVADGDHRWNVATGQTRKARTLTTRQIALLRSTGTVVRLPLAAPLDLPPVALPIDPYVVGAWLGDGAKRDGTMTKPLPALWREIEKCGYTLSKEYAGHRGTHNIYGLKDQLRAADLLNNKHVPPLYLRASYEQRLSLLQGLMDTDGCWNKLRRQATFDTTDKGLAESAYELVMSLGWRASWYEGATRGFGLTVWQYRISFRPFGAPAFRARDNAGATDIAPMNSRLRYVRSVQQIITVPTQCITVDADDELYLAGHQMTPTHNSRGADSDHAAYPEEAAQVAAYAGAQYIIVEGPVGPERQLVPALDGGLIVSIKPDGCRVYPVAL